MVKSTGDQFINQKGTQEQIMSLQITSACIILQFVLLKQTSIFLFIFSLRLHCRVYQ